MSTNPEWINPDRLNDFLDEIAELQMRNREITTEIGQIRQTAKLDGLNLEVANQLAQIRFRNPKDEGVGFLNELVEYARITGMDLDVFHDRPTVSVEEITRAAGEGRREESIYTKQLEQVIRESGRRRPTVVRQVAVGVAVTVVLMWLVH